MYHCCYSMLLFPSSSSLVPFLNFPLLRSCVLCWASNVAPCVKRSTAAKNKSCFPVPCVNIKSVLRNMSYSLMVLIQVLSHEIGLPISSKISHQTSWKSAQVQQFTRRSSSWDGGHLQGEDFLKHLVPNLESTQSRIVQADIDCTASIHTFHPIMFAKKPGCHCMKNAVR